MKYIKNCMVSGSMTGSDAGMSAIGYFQTVEDAVTELMGLLKIDGLTAQRLYGAIWVFTKNRVRFLKPLRWGEKFTAESFITALSLVKMNIDTAFRNEAGELVAYAGTELCALDTKTGKIRKVSTVGVDESMAGGAPEAEIKFAKYPEEELQLAGSAKAAFTNIDFCRHVNNVEYLRFLLNTYSVREMEEKNVKEIELCYVKQSFENDELTVYKRSGKGRDVLAVKRESETIVKCEILF